MAFPASVAQLPTTRKPTRRAKTATQEVTSPTLNEVSSGVGVGGPILDFGREGGVRLKNEGGKWGWVWANEERPELKIETGDEGVLLYPPTRRPVESRLDLTLTEKLHSATEYLSDALEEYDRIGVQEIIAEEITFTHSPSRQHEEVASRSWLNKGRVLEIVHNARAKVARTIVCFAVGEIGNDLNICPVLPWSTAQTEAMGVVRFNAIARPAISFPTGIMQLCSSPYVSTSRMGHDATVMIVRLHASTHLLNICPDPTYMPPTDASPVIVETRKILHPSDTAGLRHVDVALDPTGWSRALIVDEGGGVWLWYEEKVVVSEKLIKAMKMRQIRQPITSEREGFYNIAFGTRPGTAIVMSRRDITLLDMEGTAPPVILLSLQGKGRFFTSLEKTALEREASYSIACTTFEIVWIDEFRVRSPAISWVHDYGAGQKEDLEVTMIKRKGDDSLLLSSASDPLIMVFHVTANPPLQSHHSPHLLRTPHVPGGPLGSLAIINLRRHTHDDRYPTILLGLSEQDGSLWSIPLHSSRPINHDRAALRKTRSTNTLRPGSNRGGHMIRVHWDDKVKRLAQGRGNNDDESDAPTDYRKNGGTSFQEYNMRWAWLEINQHNIDDLPEFAVEDLEQSLRENDAPFDHIMTAGELARDLVYGESSTSRSNLLRPPPALRRDLSRKIDELDSSRYLSFAHKLRPLPESHLLFDQFPTFDPKYGPEDTDQRPSDVFRLAMDLALSRPVFYTDEISFDSPGESHKDQDSGTAEDLFARAAGALSLNDDQTPPLTFSFLTPRTGHTGHAGHTPASPRGSSSSTPVRGSSTNESEVLLSNETARAILDEWTIGADPKTYEWRPWRRGEGDPPSSPRGSRAEYDGGVSAPAPIRQIRPLPSPRSAAIGRFANTQPARHPQPLSSGTESMPSFMPLPPVIARSSPPRQMELPSSGGVGNLEFASTQVEPGRFGGRTGGGKKKVKKRVGGF